MSANAETDLIREISVEHGVALDRDDPILVLQTATRRIIQDALKLAQDAQEKALAEHRSELEMIALRWQKELGGSASAVLRTTRTGIEDAVELAVNEAITTAIARLREQQLRHERAIAAGTLTSALACALSLIAAIVVAAGLAL